jgi:ATP-dependent DNA helicase RecG
MFQMLGVGDKAGSGIDKIRSSWAAQHWQSPRLKETRRPDRVQLLLPMISTLPAEAMDNLRRRFGDVLDDIGPDELQALVAAEVEGEVTNQRLQEMLALHRADITKMLRALVGRGLLASDGVGRGTRYFPGHELPKSSPDKEHGLPDKDPGLPDKDPNSPDKDPVLLEIASPARTSKRTNPSVLRTIILNLCRDRYLTVRDLATLLKRQPGTLRDGYLTQLVESGQLELRYPERPNHPDQSYRTRSTGTSAE